MQREDADLPTYPRTRLKLDRFSRLSASNLAPNAPNGLLLLFDPRHVGSYVMPWPFKS